MFDALARWLRRSPLPLVVIFFAHAAVDARAAEPKLIGQWQPPQVGLTLPPAGFPAVAPDGAKLALAGAYGGLTVWDAKTGQQERVLLKPTGPTGFPVGPQAGLQAAMRLTSSALATDVAWSADGKQLVTFDAPMLKPGAGTLRIYDAAAGKLLHTKRLAGPAQLASPALALSTNGKQVAASLSGTKSVTVWDSATGEVSVVLPVSETGVGLAFTPDGQGLANVMLDQVELHDLARKGAKRKVADATSSHCALAFTSDGKSLVTVDLVEQQLLLNHWDVATGQAIGQPIALKVAQQDIKVHLAAFGSALAVATELKKVVVFDTRTGQSLAEVATPADVLGVSLSNTGNFLGVSCGDTTMLLWELPSPGTGN